MLGRRYLAQDALTIADLRHQALRRLPWAVAEVLEGGAEEELTLAANRQAFHKLRFRPHVLRPVTPHPLPLAIAPTGFAGLFAAKGDQALARAAAHAGVPFCQSTVSNATLEEIAPLATSGHWLQVYVFQDEAFMTNLLARAKSAGITRIIVTLDATTFGNREWDRRNFTPSGKLRLRPTIEALRHPHWLWHVRRGGLPTMGNLAAYLPAGKGNLPAATEWSRQQIATNLSPHDIAKIRQTWQGELWIKGVLRADDALDLAKLGVDGFIVSNHGGRQLDGSIASLTALPAIRSAIPEHPLWIDGGIRRGTDIAKARLLGADGVLTGRATLYGLAAAGQSGVTRALEILAQEYNRTLAQLGSSDAKDSSLLG